MQHLIRLALLCAAFSSVVAQSDMISGQISGNINGTEIKASGTCSDSPMIFEFWTDGEKFAVHEDISGDGLYFAVMVNRNMPMKVGSLQYGRNGQSVYGGSFPYSAFDGKSLTMDATIGAKSGQAGIPATFTIDCQG
jgi:hypothetical protein